MVEVERHHGQLPGQWLESRQAAGHQRPDGIERVSVWHGRGVNHNRRHHVGVHPGCLEVEERRVQPTQALHLADTTGDSPRRDSRVRRRPGYEITDPSCETRPVTMLYFVVALAGFALAVNAIRPIAIPPLGGIPAFFAGWLTAELAPHNLVAHVIVTAVFVATGAVDGPLGVVAVVLSVVTAVLL